MQINGTKMPWWKIAFDIIFGPTFLILALLKGKPAKEKPPTPLDPPTQELGQPIGVLFGRKAIDPTLIGWYGDVTIVMVPITQGGKKGSKGGGK
jgi:hypothetical protein